MSKGELDYRDCYLFNVEPFTIEVLVEYKKFPKEIKSDNCVVCLLTQPNFLLCQCGHQCLCKHCKEKIETP